MAEGVGGVKRLWGVQQRRFALWSPVMIGGGVWLRLESGWSISSAFLVLACAAGLAVFIVARRGSSGGVFASIAVLLIILGHLAASFRVGYVDAPVLEGGFRGVIEGRIVEADRSRSNAPRVILDRITLTGVHSSGIPARVRVTLIDMADAPTISKMISIRGVLGPPSGPAAPGAFDFSRQAFFRQIGAVGYARGTARIVGETEGGFFLRLARLRAEISQALRSKIGGREGAVAAALIVGDRSTIPDSTTDALRDSGLAHLLAISGLHIGLMSALTFWLVRLGLALMPVFASRFPIRKIAAVGGLAAAAGYLALAGFGVATQRAFIMAAVAFGAILLDRPAVTARGLAAAACLVLLLRPESLFEAGFQMSFAAVAALVAGYEVTRPYWKARAEDAGLLRRFSTGLIATIATSVMAGAATAPFAAYHFNRLVAYGLPANILATPVMGLWIMPAIILTALLAPFGLAGFGLVLLGWGIGYILWVADFVAGLDGAAMSVPAGTPIALACLVLGGLWLVIWQGWLRAIAALPLIGGVLLWQSADRPDILIAEDARLIAGRDETGALWVSRERKSGYSAETWLRRNGEGDVTQIAAFERRQWTCKKSVCSGETNEGTPVHLIRNRSRRNLERLCESGAIVVTPKLFGKPDYATRCTLIDRRVTDGASSISIFLRDDASPRIEIATPTPLGNNQ